MTTATGTSDTGNDIDAATDTPTTDTPEKVWIYPVIAVAIVVLLVAIIVPLTCLCRKQETPALLDDNTPSASMVLEMMTKRKRESQRKMVAGANTAFWYEEDDQSEYQNPVALKCLRKNLYSINMPAEELRLPPLPMDQRTFASSNYRMLYETARCFADTRLP